MTAEEASALVQRYRAGAEEPETPALDQTILAAAGRHARSRRLLRNTGGASIVLAVAVLGFGAAWRALQPAPEPAAVGRTDYGMIEGVTRSYLLQAGTPASPAPGLLENLR